MSAIAHSTCYIYRREDKSLKAGRQKADWQRVSPAAKLRGGAGEGERRIIKPCANLETPAAPARGPQEHLPLTLAAPTRPLFLLIIPHSTHLLLSMPYACQNKEAAVSNTFKRQSVWSCTAEAWLVYSLYFLLVLYMGETN